MLAQNSTLVFNVKRNEPELVRPARPTPNELKPLADLDDLLMLRYQQPVILVYAHKIDHDDPAKIMKAAIAEALVYYYPWAGRLKEGPTGRLLVDCTSEGVLFVEADANVRLDQFGKDSLVPPFPCPDQLFYKSTDSNTSAAVGCPIITFQVTRLLCGGFIVAFNFCHVMSDAIGAVKFLNAVSEFARGAHAPSVLPVWQRELMNARDPPRVTCTSHHDVQDQTNYVFEGPQDDLVCRTFVFNDQEIDALRAKHIDPCTTFELVSACIWHCRTIALQYPPEVKLCMPISVNIRNKFDPPFPAGYYGNGCAIAIPISPAGEIRDSFGYTVELVKKAKGDATEEYMKSLIDHAVLRGRQIPSTPNAYIVSDVSSIYYGFPSLDFGWRKPVFAGPPDNGFIASRMSFIMAYGNGKGKVVSVTLPVDAMERFVEALASLVKVE